MRYLRTVFIALVLMCVGALPAVASSVFPISESFSGAQPSTWTIAGNALWGVTVGGDQTLQLTSATNSQSGLGFYDVSFPSSLGIVAQFNYYSGGGTGADGLAFFLVDGDQVSSTTIHAGAPGGALGYAQSTSSAIDGVPHAYLGVGFDEFGNFVTNSGGMPGGLGSAVPNSVGLRGSGNGQIGYTYLTSTNVSSTFGEAVDGGWRTVRVTVVPGSGNATIRVEMSWDGGTTWHTVINNYVYNQALPANFKLGFAAGTGGLNNIHAIGDVSVTLPVNLKVTRISGGGTSLARGATTTYSYRVTNGGPNNSPTTTVTNTMPISDTGFSSATWSAAVSTGTTSAGTASNLSPLVFNLPIGSTATVTVTATAGSSILSTSTLATTITATPASDESNPDPSAAVLTVSYTPNAPTPAEARALNLISAYVASGGTTTAPAVSDYGAVGVTGVTTSNLAAVNAQIITDHSTTSTTIQTAVNKVISLMTISTYSTSAGSSAVPALSDYVNVGVTGVTSENLATINAAIAQNGSALNSRARIQAVVDATLAPQHTASGGSVRLQVAHYMAVGDTATAATLQNNWPQLFSAASDRTTLLTQLAALQTELTSLLNQYRMRTGHELEGTTTSFVTNVATLPVRDLTLGMTGADVQRLQQLLITAETGVHAATLSRIGASSYFGLATKYALGEYQEAHNIQPHTGYFGVATRRAMTAAHLSGLWW